jgi:hypothetical protein
MKATDPSSDEAFALELLKAHFTSLGETGCQCEIDKNDPPDLVIIWQNGEQWGVEVTRAYQQVQRIGKPETVSSEEVSTFLWRFAEELEEKFKETRRRDYTFVLEGPRSFNPWKCANSLTQWKIETEALIRKHIEADASDALRFCGVKLKPGEQGARWINMIGDPPAEMTSARTTMLRRSVEDKRRDLPRWRGEFAQRWLLLLSCYPHAGNATEVESALHQLDNEHDDAGGFDGIFWSGYLDRTLSRIQLAGKL